MGDFEIHVCNIKLKMPLGVNHDAPHPQAFSEAWRLGPVKHILGETKKSDRFRIFIFHEIVMNENNKQFLGFSKVSLNVMMETELKHLIFLIKTLTNDITLDHPP